jgi:hypothetical protein
MRRAILALVLLGSAVAAPAASAGGPLYFRSPSGNILCTIIPYSQTGCAVVSVRGAANVSYRGRARQVRYAPANVRRSVLGYNRYYRYGGFRCDSTTAGMRCRSLATGHGFHVSRSELDLF